jgi:Domain of unknown function (DUF4365)
MLTRNHRQEGLCRAYVRAITARCGMSISEPSPDYGIDLTLNDIAVAGNRRFESGYRLDVQVKSSVRTAAGAIDVKYDLDLPAYELLRQPGVGCPRILVVLLVPRNETQWTAQTEDELLLRHCAFWLSLKGRGATRNRRSVRLVLPRANVFSVTALRKIMHRIKTGGEP